MSLRANCSATSMVVGLAIFCCGAIFSPGGEPAPFALDKPFSADITLIRKLQGTTQQEKVYRDGEKVRIETMGANGIQKLIFRGDLRAQFILLDRQKMVIETPWPPSRFPVRFPAGADLPAGEWDFVGPELVGGIPCSKYRTRDEITNPELEIFFYWENSATNAPVQLADREESFFTRWSNYEPGPQNPDLFEPPAGYTLRKVGFPKQAD